MRSTFKSPQLWKCKNLIFLFFFHINKPVLQNCHSLTQTLTAVHTLPSFTVINHLMSVPCEVANCTFAINLSSNFF